MGDQEDAKHVVAIGMKAPQFNPDNIRGWFVVLECAFGISKISSGVTKTMHLMHAVPPKIIESVPEIDLYKSAFAEEDYEKYKAALIKRYSKTTWQNLDILFGVTSDVTRKPSEIYHQLKKLANEPDINLSERPLEYCWFKKLSKYVQSSMLGQMDSFDSDTDLEIADRFYDDELQGNNISAISESHQVAAVNQHQTRNRRILNVPKQSSKPATTGFKEDGRWCFFHFHYGNRAQKCKEGCKYLLDRPENGRQ